MEQSKKSLRKIALGFLHNRNSRAQQHSRDSTRRDDDDDIVYARRLGLRDVLKRGSNTLY